MQKLSISGYALKLSAKNVTRDSSFSLTNFLKAETSVVCTALHNSAVTAGNCSLKPWTRAFLTGHTKRMKSSQKLKNSVRVIRINDSPIECCRGWSLLGSIASCRTSLFQAQKLIYSRGVIQW